MSAEQHEYLGEFSELLLLHGYFQLLGEYRVVHDEVGIQSSEHGELWHEERMVMRSPQRVVSCAHHT